MNSLIQSVGLLFLRVTFAGMMLVGHGWPKLAGFREVSKTFPDPIGIGVVTCLMLAIFSEFFCSVLVILGLGTRLAVIPLVITMLVAAVLVHGADPFKIREPSLVYLSAFVSILIMGGGRFSLDGTLWRWMKKRPAAKSG